MSSKSARSPGNTVFTAAGGHLAAISNQPDGSARIDVYRIVE